MRLWVTLVCAGLFATGCGGRIGAPAARATDPVVQVAGRTITVGDLQEVLREGRLSFEATGRPFPEAGSPYYLDLRDEGVRYLVDRAARARAAEDLGVRVSEAEVDARLAELQHDRAWFDGTVRSAGLTMLQIRRDTREHLLDFGTFERLVARAPAGEPASETLRAFERSIDRTAGQAVYFGDFRPAPERREALPPELRSLPSPPSRCDLGPGRYDLLEAIRHGCEDLMLPAPGEGWCPSIPPDDFLFGGATSAELDWYSAQGDIAGVCIGYPEGWIEIGSDLHSMPANPDG